MDKEKRAARFGTQKPAEKESSQHPLQALIVRIADQSKGLDNNAKALGEVLAREHSSRRESDPEDQQIWQWLAAALVPQPNKSAVYAAVLSATTGLLRDHATQLTAQLELALKAGKWREVRAWLFLAAHLSCARVVNASEVLRALWSLTEHGLDLAPEISDHVTYTALATLTVLGPALIGVEDAKFGALCERLLSHIKSRDRMHLLHVTALTSDNIDDVDYLFWMAHVIDQWREKNCPPVPHVMHVPYTSAVFEEHVTEHWSTTLPWSINIAQDWLVASSEHNFHPLTKFRIFPSETTALAEDTLTNEMHRLKIELLMRDMVHYWSDDHVVFVKHVFNLPVAEHRNFEHVLIELLFEQIFKLPHCEHHRLFYYQLIIDLCKNRRDTFPLVLAEAVHRLANEISRCDLEVISLFTEWFAFHLGNFKFIWEWSIWRTWFEQYTDSSDLSHVTLSRVLFMNDALLKCVRLSVHSHIRGTVPREFEFLLPSPVPAATDESRVSEALPISTLLTKMRNREPAEQLQSWLNSVEGHTPRDHVAWTVTCLLDIGARSVSALLVVLARYAPLLQSMLSRDNELHHVIGETAVAYWSQRSSLALNYFSRPLEAEELPNLDKSLGHDGATSLNLTITLLKFISYKLMSGEHVITCLFNRQESREDRFGTGSEMIRCYFWEMIHAVIDKAINTRDLLHERVHELEKSATDQSAELLTVARDSMAVAQRDCEQQLLVALVKTAQHVMHYSALSEPSPAQQHWSHVVQGQFLALGRKYRSLVRAVLPELEQKLQEFNSPLMSRFAAIKYYAELYYTS